MRSSTHLAGLAGLAGMLAFLASGCAGQPEGRMASDCPARGRALAAAFRALGASGDVEAPRAIAAGFDSDPVCTSGRLERRVRCHLARSSVEVSGRCAARAWIFVISLPELSDHVHRARVWRPAGGGLAVRVESEN